MITVKQVSISTGLNEATIRYRSKTLKQVTELIGRSVVFTEDQKEQIRSFKREYKRDLTPKRIDVKVRFKVVECFLNSESNSDKSISEQTNIPIQTVGYIIREYLKNKYITVESKINKK